MSEAVPSLPQYAFMAWCSVEENQRDNFTFTFNFTLPLPSFFSPPKLLLYTTTKLIRRCRDILTTSVFCTVFQWINISTYRYSVTETAKYINNFYESYRN
jgi:hypothetical protein